MSYKYSNVREYQGKLLFEDRKTQNYVEINSDGIKYTRNNETPTSPYFALKFNGHESSVSFYNTLGKYNGIAEMSGFGLSFNVSGAKDQGTGVSALTGPYFSDRVRKKQCELRADGLVITDGAIGKKCTLEFENGVLTINGKEIATVENP